MKKQVVYSKFVPRLFSTTLDLAFLSLALTPVRHIVSKWTFIFIFGDFFISTGVDLNDAGAVSIATASPEFTEYLTLGLFLKYIGTLMCINSLFMSLYFIGFWYYFSATPGKMILRIRIANSEDLSKPSLGQCIKRFLYYITAFIGIWSIVITPKNQALHDKMAGTVVIKS